MRRKTMSRRDTIIIAVLVNAGLLIVLFASALKSEPSKEEFAQHPVSIPHDIPDISIQKQTGPQVGDEVDLALTQFAAPSAAPMQAPEPIVAPVSVPNFAEDLKAIGAAPQV